MTKAFAIALLKQDIQNSKINISYRHNEVGIEALELAIKALEQIRPKGKWSRKTKVDAYDIAGVKTWGIKCQCDRCDFTTIVVEDFGYYKYCPNCGADMRGDTE